MYFYSYSKLSLKITQFRFVLVTRSKPIRLLTCTVYFYPVCRNTESFILTFPLSCSSSSLYSIDGTIHPIPTQLWAVLMGRTTANIQQQALQERGGVTDDACRHHISAATAAMRQSPWATDGGTLMPTPLGSGAGTCFQNSCCTVHSYLTEEFWLVQCASMQRSESIESIAVHLQRCSHSPLNFAHENRNAQDDITAQSWAPPPEYTKDRGRVRWRR